jgi:hypothetical protein
MPKLRSLLPLALAAAPARAEPPVGPSVPMRVEGGVTEPGVRKSAFSIGVSGHRHSLKSGDNEVIGNAGAVQLGTGYISESWYAAFSLDILLGPYEPTRGSQLNVDYSGTGLTLWTGFSAQGMNLRSPEGGYGFALGLSYADIVGRSIGKNRREDEDDPTGSPGLIENYIMRVNNLSLLPAIFFSWLAPPRPRGNTPELLMTRLEGYFLTLGMAMPLLSSYSARYTVRPEPGQPTAPQKLEKGELRGYSILMSFTAILGT